jgi:hypothetical protein
MTTSIGFYADATTDVHVHVYGTKRTPILAIDGPDSSLTVTTFDRVPVADHLAFARSLAAAATEYLTALETYAATIAVNGQDPEANR